MKKVLKLSFVIYISTNLLFAQEQKTSQGEKIPCKEISIGCLMLGRDLDGEHVIRNDTEYQKLLDFPSPHSNCGSYKLPPIDFTKYTLIGYISGIAECKLPKVVHQVSKKNNNYTINITIMQQGICKMNNSIKLWCLIPKINESSILDFQVKREIEYMNDKERKNMEEYLNNK